MVSRGKCATLLAAALAGLLVGCGDVLSARAEAREPGILQLIGYGGMRPAALAGAPDWSVVWNQAPGDSGVITPPQVIVAPEVVSRGESFDVVVHTIGGSGCWRADGMDVRVAAPLTELRPYDRHSGAEFCTGVLVDLVHRTTLTLQEPGEWTLLVVGRRVQHGDAWSSLPVTAEKTIVVQ